MTKKTLERLNRDFPGYNIRKIDNHIYILDYRSRIRIHIESFNDESQFDEFYDVTKEFIQLEINIVFNHMSADDAFNYMNGGQ